MPVVQTFRPTILLEGSGFSAVGAGSIPAALADDSDSSYAERAIVNASLPDGGVKVLRVGAGNQSPPANHQRHRARIRFRADYDNPSFPTTRPATLRCRPAISTRNGPFTTANIQGVTPRTTYVGGWTTNFQPGGLLPGGSFNHTWRFEASTAAELAGDIRIYEAWFDVDCRARPTFAGRVLDGAGDVVSNGGTISDTTVPRFIFRDYDRDGLPARDYQIWIYTLAQTLAGGFSAFATTPFRRIDGVGNPPGASANSDSQPFDVGALPNGDYVAYFRASTTIRGSDPFVSTVQTRAFEMDVDAPAAPVPVVTVQPPNAQVCWTSGPNTGTDWDNPNEIVVEIQRSDCFRDWFTIDVSQRTSLADCFVDRFVPLFDDCPDCDSDEDEFNCEVLYRVRYWGMVGDVLMSTDWGVT